MDLLESKKVTLYVERKHMAPAKPPAVRKTGVAFEAAPKIPVKNFPNVAYCSSTVVPLLFHKLHCRVLSKQFDQGGGH